MSEDSIDLTDLIEVICYCMPDGSVHWFNKKDSAAANFFHAWKMENAEFMNTECKAGMVTLSMPRFYYEQLELTDIQLKAKFKKTV